MNDSGAGPIDQDRDRAAARVADRILGWLAEETRPRAGEDETPGQPAHAAATGAQDGEDMPAVVALPQILMRTSHEITAVLHSLYRSHAFLEQSAVQRLNGTRQRLHDVTAATETATFAILDGLDHTLVLLDQLGCGGQPAQQAEARSRLHQEIREGVHRLITALQFQDIVAQQIAFAVRVLEDTERRMIGISERIESTVMGHDHSPLRDSDHTDFDPLASMSDASPRQAVADSIFAGDAVPAVAPDA